MRYSNDTIAAISTPSGHGALAVIRLSGPDSLSVAHRIFKSQTSKKDFKPRTVYTGFLTDPASGADIDQVLLTCFTNPRSFTGEDMLEISSHGGLAIPYKILEIILRQGVRLAEPGEFTRRAFLNQKITLSQAEAINDLILMQNYQGASLALSNLNAELDKRLVPVKNELMKLLAKLEISIDMPEEEIAPFSSEDVRILDNSIKTIEKILSIGDASRKIARGYRVVIAGKTNVGKSSLLNCLSGEERAIVSHIHGTTRDVIEVELSIRGQPVILIDTAGIRDAYENEIEGYGIIKTRQNLKKADLVLLLLDAAEGVDSKDLQIYSELEAEKTLVCINKTDTGETLRPEVLSGFNRSEMLKISARNHEGIEALLASISAKLTDIPMEKASFYLNLRQDETLRRFLKALEDTAELLQKEEQIELVCFRLNEAIKILGELMGFSLETELLDTIFSNFCIGK